MNEYYGYVLDDVCTLINQGFLRGTYGERIENRTERTVFCMRKSASQSEFFKAHQDGLRPQGVLIIDKSEYQGEQLVEYGNTVYSIYRVYETKGNYCELYIEERAGVEDDS